MNWEAVAAIAELAGAAGVIASLGYLAVQIRRGATSTNMAAFQESVRSAQELATLIAQDGELAHLIVSGSQNRDDLSTDDRLRFHSFWSAMFMNMEMGFHHRRNGMLESEVFDSQARDLLTYLRSPGVLSWWQSHGDSYNASFRFYVDELLERDQAAGEKGRAPPNKALQLTWHSAFQSTFGRVWH